MATSYLTRAAQTATSNTTMTISAWVKRSHIGSTSGGTIWMHENIASHDNKILLFFTGAVDQISFQTYNGSTEYNLTPTRKLRDTNGWYHVVAIWNTTAGTTADRMQIWINGIRETSFTTANYPSQNATINLSSKDQQIGRYVGSGGVSNYWDGLMSQFVYVDGQAYAPSNFAQTDSVTGEWKPKTDLSGLTYGNRGVWLKMEDSSNLGLDSSGNSNNYTNSGVTQTLDCPSNLFDTINLAFPKTAGVNGRDSSIRIFIKNGNTELATDVALWTTMLGSIPMATGKYYWECRRTFGGSPSNHLARVGIEEISTAGTSLGSPVGTNTNSINYQSEGGGLKSNSGYSGTYASWQANNDIVQVAVDLDNYFIYFGKNGAWQNSGDPTSGSSGTGGIAMLAGKTYVNGFTVHRGGGSSGGDQSKLQMNFGNGYFGSTAVSSAGSNASGNGIFEYDVPAGYTALSTKGLNT